ncbi:hypothetical protein IJI72_02665 [Candidatus Saccharibacteria bacterium]|nr:hypothetical protein [Candidatus Saccharibacteria bacterium]
MEIRIQKTLNRKPKKYYWELINEQGKIIAASENYRSYSKCLHDLVYVTLAAFSAKIIDATNNEPRQLNPGTNINLDALESDATLREEELLSSDSSLLASAPDSALDALELGETEPRVSLGDTD